MATELQQNLFGPETSIPGRTGSFVDNMKLPVHRWFRYSAGFSAAWVESVLLDSPKPKRVRVLDPFAGSGTTLICSEQAGVPSYGIEAHRFVARVARAKLAYKEDPNEYSRSIEHVVRHARQLRGQVDQFAPLIRRCFTDQSLSALAALSEAVFKQLDETPRSELVWLTLVAILRSVSHVGTAPWQYILPNRTKRTLEPFEAFELMARTMAADMRVMTKDVVPSKLITGDARTCEGVPEGFASLVITSPPYANNYDYADATRLEMTFMGEIENWSDLQQVVRKYLVRSCSQHVTERTIDLAAVLASPELEPIRAELQPICEELGDTRLTRKGKKNYHLMAACYFADMAQVWAALRRVCSSDARVCFVIGDSAPYGIHLPVVEWMGALSLAAGFDNWRFEKLRDRNIKWKNRKHRIPLVEGRLWVNS